MSSEFFDDEGRVKLDASGWQIFFDTKGAGAAARSMSARLTTMIRRAKAAREKNPLLGRQELAQDIVQRFYSNRDSVMEEFGSFGATDTEPRGVLLDVLEEAFELGHGSLTY